MVGLLLLSLAVGQGDFPVDYPQQMVHYATVDRKDGKSRDIFISLEGYQAIKQKKELPIGTQVVIDVHNLGAKGQRSRADKYIHAMTKIPGEGSKAWMFFALDPKTGTGEPGVSAPGDCLECHKAALASDLLFSLDKLKAYVATGQVQRAFCKQPGRQLC